MRLRPRPAPRETHQITIRRIPTDGPLRLIEWVCSACPAWGVDGQDAALDKAAEHRDSEGTA